MTILYPVNDRLMIRKARDARILRMARAFAEVGHRVYLLIGRTARRDEEILQYYGVSPNPNLSIVQLPILRGKGRIRVTINEVFLWAAFWQIKQMGRLEPIDVMYFTVLDVADFFLKRKKGIRAAKFVYELHELARYPENASPSPGQIREDALERRVLSQMNGVFATTETLRRVLAERFPHLPSATIPLGVTPPVHTYPFQFGKEGKINICYIGQLYDAQGVDILIKGMPFLPQAEAHIIGGTKTECDSLRKLAREQGVGERIIFHGFIEPGQIPEQMKNMDLFVVPAKNTVRMNYVAHIKIYEYMAAGRPIVATRLRSIAEELEDGKTGVLVEPDDPQALAGGIQRLIANPVWAGEIAQRAYRESAKYHWEKRAEKIIRFLQSLDVDPSKNLPKNRIRHRNYNS
jgi:glycosyltransferase involved in cell wall biosynthesis